MGSNFFDIPFRSRSLDSDFICRDGEIASLSGVSLYDTSGRRIEATDTPGAEVSSQVFPVPEVTFALSRTTLPGWHVHPDVFPAKHVPATDPSMDYWTKMGAQLLALFKSEAENQNLFVAPFFVSAVWKTASGNYAGASEPVVLVPNSEVPLVAVSGNLSAQELEMRIAGAICRLKMKMRAGEELRDYVGTISSLEIFVSTPLQSYDTFHSFVPQRNVTSRSWCECLNETTLEIERQKICDVTLEMAWRGIQTGMLPDSLYPGKADPLLLSEKFYLFASIPLRDVDLLEEWTDLSASYGWRRGGYSGSPVAYSTITGNATGSVASTPAIISGEGTEFTFETRPLKLSGAGLFKSVQKIFLRGDFNPRAINLKVLASRDMQCWWSVALRNGGQETVLPHSRFRFYKFAASGTLAPGETLQGLTVILRTNPTS